MTTPLQLDLFTVDAGPGWYSIQTDWGMGGTGRMDWFETEADALAALETAIERSRRTASRGGRTPKVTGSAKLYPGHPPFVLERKRAWIAATNGERVICADHLIWREEDGSYPMTDEEWDRYEAWRAALPPIGWVIACMVTTPGVPDSSDHPSHPWDDGIELERAA